MLRLLLIGLVLSGLWGMDTTVALAQRDAGAKGRGDSGTFWEPVNRRANRRQIEYRPMRPNVESYRSFSYEPIAINTGDTVVVRGEDTQMMRGTNVVGHVPNGLEFRVTQVINGWLGAVVEVDGQTLNGWVRHTDVALKGDTATARRPAAPMRTYRRFSYEPLQPSTSYPSYRADGRAYGGGGSSWRWANPKAGYGQ